MKIITIEGSRGTGKSTIAHQLRQELKDTTLINFTGFNTDGEEGFKRITDYYMNWIAMFIQMKQAGLEHTILCDRIFFSEMVFSKLYKNYDFREVYAFLVEAFALLEPTIFYLTIEDEEELGRRLQRDKVPFHNVEESVTETFKQQAEYDKVFKDIEDKFNIVTIDTTHLTAEQVKGIILSKI